MGQDVAVFDAHLHPEGLSDRDLETLRLFGVERALALAHFTPLEAKAKAILAHFDDLAGRQLRRLERAGIHGYVALGIDPRAVPRRGLHQVLAALPGYFRGGRVVALGELGLQEGTVEEVEALLEQLGLAKELGLPVIVHTPHRHKERLTRRVLNLLREAEVPPERVLVDHASPKTVRTVLAFGYYAGLTVHPEELTAERAVELIRTLGPERLVLNSDCGDGPGDLLAVPRMARLLERAGLSARVRAAVLGVNASRLLGRTSGR
jgi:uncharacterized protein